MTLNSELNFREHGVQIISGVLSSEKIAHLKEVFPNDVSGIRNLSEKYSSLPDLIQFDILKAHLEELGHGRLTLVRSLFFDKNEKRNWNVAWHQDLTISVNKKIETPGFGPWSVKDGTIHVQPPVEILERMVALRIHLDDCDESNGALRVIPKSHKFGKLAPERTKAFTQGKTHTCAMKVGDVIVMRPLLLHASSKATNPTHRRVIHLEFSPDKLPNGLNWVE